MLTTQEITDLLREYTFRVLSNERNRIANTLIVGFLTQEEIDAKDAKEIELKDKILGAYLEAQERIYNAEEEGRNYSQQLAVREEEVERLYAALPQEDNKF